MAAMTGTCKWRAYNRPEETNHAHRARAVDFRSRRLCPEPAEPAEPPAVPRRSQLAAAARRGERRAARLRPGRGHCGEREGRPRLDHPPPFDAAARRMGPEEQPAGDASLLQV